MLPGLLQVPGHVRQTRRRSQGAFYHAPAHSDRSTDRARLLVAAQRDKKSLSLGRIAAPLMRGTRRQHRLGRWVREETEELVASPQELVDRFKLEDLV